MSERAMAAIALAQKNIARYEEARLNGTISATVCNRWIAKLKEDIKSLNDFQLIRFHI